MESLTDAGEILVNVTAPRVEREIGQLEETAAEEETAEPAQAPQTGSGSW